MDGMGAIIHNGELEHQHSRTHMQGAGYGLKSLAVLASVLPFSHPCQWGSSWPSWSVRADMGLSHLKRWWDKEAPGGCIRSTADHNLQNTAVSIVPNLHRKPVGLDCYMLCDDDLVRMFLLEDLRKACLLQKVLQSKKRAVGWCQSIVPGQVYQHHHTHRWNEPQGSGFEVFPLFSYFLVVF